jgi:hypothetical protein
VDLFLKKLLKLLNLHSKVSKTLEEPDPKHIRWDDKKKLILFLLHNTKSSEFEKENLKHHYLVL